MKAVRIVLVDQQQRCPMSDAAPLMKDPKKDIDVESGSTIDRQ